MLRTTNVRMGVRLALVEGEDADTALIFESESARATHAHAAGGLAAGASAGRGGSLSAASVCSANGKSVALPADPVADVTVRELRLTHTLLASAVRLQRPARRACGVLLRCRELASRALHAGALRAACDAS